MVDYESFLRAKAHVGGNHCSHHDTRHGIIHWGGIMARYDAKRKIKRNQQLLEYRRQNPDLSLREIGDAFGVTPGRVWALLRRLEQKGR